MSKSFFILSFLVGISFSLYAQKMVDVASLLMNITQSDSIVLVNHIKATKIMSNGKVISHLIIGRKRLQDSLKLELFDLITSPNLDSVALACPNLNSSNSVLIYKNKMVNFIELIFECNNYVFSLDKKVVGPFDGDYDNFKKLKELFKSIGIKVD